MSDYQHDMLKELKEINRKLDMLFGVIGEAEKEIPEYARRFVMYFHDLAHIRWVYEEKGMSIPRHIDHEIERCHDRYKKILERENNQGGAFQRIAEEMASEGGTQYLHGRRKA